MYICREYPWHCDKFYICNSLGRFGGWRVGQVVRAEGEGGGGEGKGPSAVSAAHLGDWRRLGSQASGSG